MGEFSEYAKYFSNRTYTFDRKQRALAFCETATRESLRAFLKDVLRPGSRMCHQVTKILDKPDKDLPEGAITPELGAENRLWTSHCDVVRDFHASAEWQPVGK